MRNNLKCKIGGAVLKNPVIAASGTFGYGAVMEKIFSLDILGGFVTKTITLNPRKGNRPPRIYDLGFGIINSIGLENPGVEEFKKEYLGVYNSIDTAIFASIYGEKLTEWKKLIFSLNDTNITGFELNFSCPNIEGKIISAERKKVYRVVSTIRGITRKPLIAKLSFSHQIKDVVLGLRDAGIDAVTAINTLPAMALDDKSHKPILGNVIGGLSGPCIKPIALRAVYEISKTSSVPVIGCGGIMNWEDAVDFLSVGAKAVQVGTANLVNPESCRDIVKGLGKYYE